MLFIPIPNGKTAGTCRINGAPCEFTIADGVFSFRPFGSNEPWDRRKILNPPEDGTFTDLDGADEDNLAEAVVLIREEASETAKDDFEALSKIRRCMVDEVRALRGEHPDKDYVGCVAIIRTANGEHRVGFDIYEREELARLLEMDGGEGGQELAAELRDPPHGAIFSTVLVEPDGSTTVHHERSEYEQRPSLN
jgi:hypothetical protein